MLYHKDEIPDRTLRPHPPTKKKTGNKWEVEYIVDSHVVRGKLQYLVHWKGYSKAEETWESAANLKKSPRPIKEFHKKYPDAPQPISLIDTTPVDGVFPPRRKGQIYDPATDTIQIYDQDRDDWDHSRDLQITLDNSNASAPKYAHEDDAGMDLAASEPTTIQAHSWGLVSTGLHFTTPRGTYGRIAPWSGLAVKGIDVGAGVIDRGYTGKIKILLINNTDENFTVNIGDRVAQLVIERIITPVISLVDYLKSSARGHRGFGSTGDNYFQKPRQRPDSGQTV